MKFFLLAIVSSSVVLSSIDAKPLSNQNDKTDIQNGTPSGYGDIPNSQQETADTNSDSTPRPEKISISFNDKENNLLPSFRIGNIPNPLSYLQYLPFVGKKQNVDFNAMNPLNVLPNFSFNADSPKGIPKFSFGLKNGLPNYSMNTNLPFNIPNFSVNSRDGLPNFSIGTTNSQLGLPNYPFISQSGFPNFPLNSQTNPPNFSVNSRNGLPNYSTSSGLQFDGLPIFSVKPNKQFGLPNLNGLNPLNNLQSNGWSSPNIDSQQISAQVSAMQRAYEQLKKEAEKNKNNNVIQQAFVNVENFLNAARQFFDIATFGIPSFVSENVNKFLATVPRVEIKNYKV